MGNTRQNGLKRHRCRVRVEYHISVLSIKKWTRRHRYQGFHWITGKIVKWLDLVPVSSEWSLVLVRRPTSGLCSDVLLPLDFQRRVHVSMFNTEWGRDIPELDGRSVVLPLL